ncbi:GNAT family N-acetyltransferase, putative [Talaromyces marneffei ATCC 18224]|uniref:GNAT family N-acetyltransferase, putative n=1 Tax=Talaromyces marneffei (strain ATCC 18224 / CBS 334.59 / QM 7333) TaxID=441960 RepID=B6QML3_TALMQ|nr:GNAT family N-acetyltransferase, putative [Talaromyces marneffei ATCC 18224]
MVQTNSTEAMEIKINDDSSRTTLTPSFVLRTFRPGDLGYIVHRNGVYYDEQYQWGTRFEAVVARIVADFVDTYDPSKERCWIAERKGDGAFLGSIMLVKDRESVDPSKIAKLRLLFVEPEARGMGLGAALVRQCYSRIGLWTQGILLAARRLYAREGYKLVRLEEHQAFDIPMTGEHWELTL